MREGQAGMNLYLVTFFGIKNYSLQVEDDDFRKFI